ncbi:hypothetical protein [Novosphingobium lindaniclasticum]
MSGIIAVLVAGLVLAALATPRERPVTRTRRGLELKAHKGRLVHVRETESEHEI